MQVTLSQIIAAIQVRQPVLNLDDLNPNNPSLNKLSSNNLNPDNLNANNPNSESSNPDNSNPDMPKEKNSPTTGSNITVTGIASLDNATQHQLSFIASSKYIPKLKHTKAAIVLVAPKFANEVPKHSLAIITQSPYLAYACVTHLFEPSYDQPSPISNIHPTAQIATTATVQKGVRIGAYCVVGEHAYIGENSTLQPHTTVGEYVRIGKHCFIGPQVSIAHGCHIGDYVRIHANASIGSEGFGFAPTGDLAIQGWERIAQLGRVIIGNHVRIGSQTCIDRGALDDTVIGNNVIIDNLVQIAHNVKIGAGTAIAANTGIAGSTKIGKRCIIAGAVGIVGHIEIADDVTLTSMTMVTKSIKKSGSYSSGIVSMPTVDWRRAVVKFKNMGKKTR